MSTKEQIIDRALIAASGGPDAQRIARLEDELARLRKRLTLPRKGDADTINLLRAALIAAQEKLTIYRADSNGEYRGGMEYGMLMQMIDRALGQPAN
jgi:hypothetical protein